jgi:hypothetical protein
VLIGLAGAIFLGGVRLMSGTHSPWVKGAGFIVVIACLLGVLLLGVYLVVFMYFFEAN